MLRNAMTLRCETQKPFLLEKMQTRFQAAIIRNGASWRADMVAEVVRSQSRTTRGNSSCMDTSTSPRKIVSPSPDAYSIVTRVQDNESASKSAPSSKNPLPKHSNVASSQDSNVSKPSFSFSGFRWGRVIGAGSFGRVALATFLENGQKVAIKSISKAHTIHQGQVTHLRQEIGLLSRIQHNFVVGFYGSFQDSNFIYLVLEYVAGGDFFKLLRESTKSEQVIAPHTGIVTVRQSCLQEVDARFYAGQILLALDHLHKSKIAYRDLKPENVLVTDEGYLKLTDFGFAKSVQSKTYTFCGTPDYMAPEILSAKARGSKHGGYGVEVDIWALGCLIFETLTGKGPFYTGDVKETYKRILASGHILDKQFENLKSKGQILSPGAEDIIRGCLQTDSRLRLTTGQMLNHRWFQGLDWKLLYNGQYRPPVVRKSSQAGAFFDEFTLGPFVHPVLPLAYTPSYINEIFMDF